jgi:hypothetical protein
MQRFNYHDFKTFEKSPTSPSALQYKLTELIYNSWNTRCKVDSVNPETGEYRVILQGTCDWNWTNWEPPY